MARTWPNAAANRLRIGGNPSRLNFPGNGEPFTLTSWVKLASISAAGGDTFISKYDGSFGPMLRIIDTGTKNKLSFFFIDTGTSGHDAIGATVLSTGVWLHIGCTWDGSSAPTVKNLLVFLNGVQDGSSTSPGMKTTSESVDGWTLGARASATKPIDGVMCEVAMWNINLSANEMLALAHGVNPFQVAPHNLKGYWPIYGAAAPENDLTDGSNEFQLVGTLNAANHAPVGPPTPHGILFSMPDPGLISGGVPPSNTVAPSIIAWPEVARLEISDGGTWTGDAVISYVYSWEHNTGLAGGSWTTIPAAASLQYRIDNAYLNHWLRVKVDATNAAGAATAYSSSAGPATGFPGSHYASVAVG